MSPVDPEAVIVVDDACRVALYLWRYLSCTVGFGIGTVLHDGKVKNDQGEKGNKGYFRDTQGAAEGLPTPTRQHEVWWVNAKGKWWTELDEVLKRTRQRNRRFLVDVRGPYTRKGSGAEGVDGVLERLWHEQVRIENDFEKSQVLLVSSYQSAPHPVSLGRARHYLRIYPKSPETFQLFWLPRPSRDEISYANILVTGAGFERCDDKVLQLGTDGTAEMLDTVLMLNGLEAEKSEGYPFPREYTSELFKAANSSLLDTYWNKLLELTLQKAKNKYPLEDDRFDKVKASEDEYELRSSFREQLLRDDWGFLNQALDAVKMPGLVGWLTTNYTRFADRAINLGKERPQEGQPDWRIVATANEANRLLRELLQKSEEADKKEVDKKRYLFKLHGDIAQLLTMAVAGYDKDFFSPLSLPIDSLHPVYTAAESFLKDRLKQASAIVWHIVGHSLKDRLLMRLIRCVRDATRPERHHFIIVDKHPKEENLRKELKFESPIYLIKASARDYMAQGNDLPLKLTQAALKEWIADRFAS